MWYMESLLHVGSQGVGGPLLAHPRHRRLLAMLVVFDWRLEARGTRVAALDQRASPPHRAHPQQSRSRQADVPAAPTCPTSH